MALFGFATYFQKQSGQCALAPIFATSGLLLVAPQRKLSAACFFVLCCSAVFVSVVVCVMNRQGGTACCLVQTARSLCAVLPCALHSSMAPIHASHSVRCSFDCAHAWFGWSDEERAQAEKFQQYLNLRGGRLVLTVTDTLLSCSFIHLYTASLSD